MGSRAAFLGHKEQEAKAKCAFATPYETSDSVQVVMFWRVGRKMSSEAKLSRQKSLSWAIRQSISVVKNCPSLHSRMWCSNLRYSFSPHN